MYNDYLGTTIIEDVNDSNFKAEINLSETTRIQFTLYNLMEKYILDKIKSNNLFLFFLLYFFQNQICKKIFPHYFQLNK